jgi:hypothetical protein
MPHATLTRRTFAKLLGGALAAHAGGLAPLPTSGVLFACVASRSKQNSGLHLFSCEKDRWHRVDFVPVQAPSALVPLPRGRGLFVANAISDFHHRPSGSVESYLLDRETGRLMLASREGLTLAATEPGHLAISPCGRRLAVLAGGGSILNILPVSNSGTLGTPYLVRKQIAHPMPPNAVSHSQLAFARDGSLLWGHAGRVTRFTLTGQAFISNDLARMPDLLNPDRAAVGSPTSVAAMPDASAFLLL